MFGRKRSLVLVVVGLLVSGFAWTAMAQGGAPAGGGRGGGGGDPAAMRARMLEGIKTSLAVTDEEWKALEPKVEKVVTLQAESRSGMMGGRRGGGGGATPAPTTDTGKAAQELRTVLDNAASTPEQIKEKLAAYRAARDKNRDELAKAQEGLREVLTVKQEAQLVLRGLLN